MAEPAIVGWDIGGAHVKAVLVEAGRARDAVQLACPLWRGMDHLQQAVSTVMARYHGRRLSHAVTMTGELADIFPDRPSGVRMISDQMRSLLGTAPLAIYAGPHGLLHERPSEPLLTAIASANWHASAVFVASRSRDGLLIDIGSTTSDIIPLQAGRPCFSGYSDAERLATQELVYSGIVRTPVMAVARRAPFAGTWQGLAAEHFATMADVYRLTGELPNGVDMADTADGAGKTPEASARRLARMIGRDVEEASAADWKQLAVFFRSRQLAMLESALLGVLSRVPMPVEVPLLAAGSGRFLVHRLAARLGRPCVDVDTLMQADSACRDWLAVCLPAYAVASLLESGQSC